VVVVVVVVCLLESRTLGKSEEFMLSIQSQYLNKRAFGVYREQLKISTLHCGGKYICLTPSNRESTGI